MKVEDEKPTITYEAFVEDLDEGDSFTASLVDVLVKVRQFWVLTPIYCSSHFSRSWQSAGHGQTPETVASSLNELRRVFACRLLLCTSIEAAMVRARETVVSRFLLAVALHHSTVTSTTCSLIRTEKPSMERCWAQAANSKVHVSTLIYMTPTSLPLSTFPEPSPAQIVRLALRNLQKLRQVEPGSQ